jgi:lipoate-protein ligase A
MPDVARAVPSGEAPPEASLRVHGGGDRQYAFRDSGALSGAENMRLDEEAALALQAGRGRPLLRLYRWHPWAISLGYNQKSGDVDGARARADGIDVVRRPTGGRAILHAEELTYSVVMYAGRRGILETYNAISEALVAGLRLYGADVTLQKSQPDFGAHYRDASSVPCFTASARYEIEWQGRKLVGSAQRRYCDGEHDVVLQHGSLLCGPAHRRLIDYLREGSPAVIARMRREMDAKTVDLAEASGAPVDLAHLASCLRRGFEEAWHIHCEDQA